MPAPVRIAALLYTVNVALVVLHLAFVWLDPVSIPFRALLNLDAEGTIPAWYTSAQLLIIGLLFILAASRRPPGAAVAPWFLLLIGAGFVFLSMDEVAGVHETTTLVLKRFESLPRFKGDHGIWIPIYLLTGASIVAVTAKSWVRLFRAHRRGVLVIGLGALLFLLGAVGMEVYSYEALREPRNYRPYMVGVAVEEGLEMFGVSTMLLGSMLVTAGLVERTEPPT